LRARPGDPAFLGARSSTLKNGKEGLAGSLLFSKEEPVLAITHCEYDPAFLGARSSTLKNGKEGAASSEK